MESQKVYIDHILLQLNKEEFESLPSGISDNFTVIDGGIHIGGFSRNKLIVFSDGTYLELYNWITKPEDWRQRLPGDWALTTLEPVSAEVSHQRIAEVLVKASGDGGLGVTYFPPQEGGRQTPQGEEIRWKIVKAEYHHSDLTPAESFYPRGRTDAPFFCHDVTPRSRRVVFNLPAITSHPSGATGIAGVEILVPKDRCNSYKTLYTAVVGEVPEELQDGSAQFQLRAPGVQSYSGFIRIRPARTQEDERFLKEKGIGICSLLIRSASRGEIVFPIWDYLL